MANPITPYKTSKASKKEQVRLMFDGISSSYDRANHFISMGMDASWKKKLIKLVLQEQPTAVLDLATGTADLPLQMAEKGLKNIHALDLSSNMITVAQERLSAHKLLENQVQLHVGDAEALPFSADTFDVVTVSYGLRNYENLSLGLQETYRVLKPHGAFIILETSVPKHFPFKQVYSVFTKGLVPFMGSMFSKDKEAYRYLSTSAADFPCGQDLLNILEKEGFKPEKVDLQFFGAATIYLCRK